MILPSGNHSSTTPLCRVCGVAWRPGERGDGDPQPRPVCRCQAEPEDKPGGGSGSLAQANIATTILPAKVAVAGGVQAGLPRRFAHYELVLSTADGCSPVELGRGTMGVTYRARDVILDCPVALKVIDPGLSITHPEMPTRFLREAQAAASLRHANVASVFHFGEQDGRCFYAMELVEGETLEARVRRAGPLPLAQAMEVAWQVAQALVAAQAQGIVHRDLKPANLMVRATPESGVSDAEDEGLQVKVIDFGLVKATTAAAMGHEAADLTHGGFVGTPAFASPEQFAFDLETIDPRADIYSLGVTLWYLLTGRVPFAGHTLTEIHHRKTHRSLPLDQLDRAKVPAAVVKLLETMLAADPARRPQGARDLVGQLRHCRKQLLPGGGQAVGDAGEGGGKQPRRPGERRNFRAVGTLGAGLVLLVVAAWWGVGVVHRRGKPLPDLPPAVTRDIPEKSVAVLPFENLSDDQANAYFASGMQQEILTNLAQVAELKVISRSSVMPYGEISKRSNLPEIARALGVTHIVEGSVQRAGNRIRITAQLIDARNDTHRWAEHYDRDLSDVFALQSEIAERIAVGLRAKLSPREKAAIDARPTEDLVAYDLYLQARELVTGFQETADWRETLLRSLRLLEEATRRDGSFALAWCLTAQAHDQLYYTGLDATPARLAMQEHAVNVTLGLRPDLGEAHLARARLLYRSRQDYEGARRELAAARTSLPNSSEVFALASYIDRRLGRWQEAMTHQEKASSLDPSSRPSFLNDQTVLLDMLRRYPEEIRAAEAAMRELPGSEGYYRLIKAQALLAAGQTRAARVQLDALPPGFDPNGAVTYSRVSAALYGGDPAAAGEALTAFRGKDYAGFNGTIMPRTWLEVLVARAAGDSARAQTLLWPLREITDLAVRQRPGDPFALALLGQVDAALGHKAEALAAGRRAVEMRPVSADAMDGPTLQASLALICAWSGEADEAMRNLLVLAKIPGGPDYGQLRDDPAWAPLRERADYQAMLAGLDQHMGP